MLSNGTIRIFKLLDQQGKLRKRLDPLYNQYDFNSDLTLRSTSFLRFNYNTFNYNVGIGYEVYKDNSSNSNLNLYDMFRRGDYSTLSYYLSGKRFSNITGKYNINIGYKNQLDGNNIENIISLGKNISFNGCSNTVYIGNNTNTVKYTINNSISIGNDITPLENTVIFRPNSSQGIVKIIPSATQSNELLLRGYGNNYIYLSTATTYLTSCTVGVDASTCNIKNSTVSIKGTLDVNTGTFSVNNSNLKASGTNNANHNIEFVLNDSATSGTQGGTSGGYLKLIVNGATRYINLIA
jgi:hypothetical protein